MSGSVFVETAFTILHTEATNSVISKIRLWNAYYKGWFAGRAGRSYPPVDSMVEHSFMVDGYDLGRRNTGRPSHASVLASQINGEGLGGAADSSLSNEAAASGEGRMSNEAQQRDSDSGVDAGESQENAAQADE